MAGVSLLQAQAPYLAAPAFAAPSGQVQALPSQMPFAQTQALQQAVSTPQALGNIELLGQYTAPSGFPLYHYVLGNGHQVLLEQSPTDAISLRTFIKAGSAAEAPVYKSPLYAADGLPPGIAHFDEHCHFLSTEHFPQRNRWSQVVEGLGAYLNASTGYETIQHELMFNKEDTAQMLKLHAEAVMHPRYDASLLFQEKRNVINECSERMEDPQALIYSKALELLFDRPHFQSLGNRGDVQRTTVEQLQQFYNTYYTPTNMLTVISGNLKPEQVLPLLNEGFGQKPPQIQTQPPCSLKLALGQNEVRTLTLTDPQLTVPTVCMAFPAPPVTALKDRVAMVVLQDLLTGSPVADMPRVLEEQLGVASNVGMSYEPYRTTGMVSLSMNTPEGQPQGQGAAVTQALALLAQAGQSPPPEQRLNDTKKKLLEAYKQAHSSNELSTNMLGNEALEQTLPYALNFEALVQSLTAQDVQRVAQTYLNPNRFALVYGLPGTEKTFSPKLSTTPEKGSVVLQTFHPEGTVQTPVAPTVTSPPAPQMASLFQQQAQSLPTQQASPMQNGGYWA